MVKYQTKAAKAQAGFTLVELAIVMIIIGLLIGGVLKGQELIGNAQVTATVSQIKGVDAAASTFRDSYNATAGDFRAADTRLPATGCGGAACGIGNGNGFINQGPGAAPALGAENVLFFEHLRAAELLSGFDGTQSLTFGQVLPTSPVGGGLISGDTRGTGGTGLIGGGALSSGLYVILTGSPAAAGTVGVVIPTQAARIDRKLDDGVPTSGTVQVGNETGCTTGGTPDEYNEADKAVQCSVFSKIQG